MLRRELDGSVVTFAGKEADKWQDPEKETRRVVVVRPAPMHKHRR